MSGSPFPNPDDWHALRLRNIGGSEVAALYGVQPAYALSLYALWHVKAGNAPQPPVDNERVRWGNRLEAPIAHGLAEDQGWTITKGGYVTDPTTPGMACTLDFVVHDPAQPDPGALEIKNVDWLVHKRTWADGEPPLPILLQLQHQLACTGYTWGAVGGLVGGNDAHLYRYEARPALIAGIRQRVTAFWQSIAEGREPPPDGSDAAAAVLRALYPDVLDEVSDLTTDNALPDICARLLAAAEARKVAEKAEAEAKNQLAAKLGGHNRALVQGYRVSVAVTPEKPPAAPPEGYLIPGRKEVRRITVKEAA